MSDTSYEIEIRQASKNGYYTPEESNRAYALKYDRTTLIAHWWGAPGTTGNHDQTVNYILGQAQGGNMSVNYVVSDGKITMVVPPDMVSWGAGPKGNPIGVNVEHDPNLGAEGYKKAGWLLDQLEQRFNRSLSVTRHSDYMQTQCCGHIDPNRIRAEADKWKRGEYDRPPAPLYTVEAISPKQIKVRAGMRKWNLAHGSFQDVANNPITTASDNELFTATAILHHREIPQYNYYLEDAGTPHGWNVLDCMDYTPPPPPYVPPAPPAPIPTVTYYEIKPSVLKYYDSADEAKTDSNAKGLLDKGVYVEQGRDNSAVKITKNNQDIASFWVNDLDNKPEPEPPVPTEPVDVVVPEAEPVDPPAPALPKHQFQMIQPIQLEAINAEPQVFPDLEGKTTIKAQLNPGSVKEYSMETYVGGERYLIPTLSMKRGWRHGIPADLLDYPQMHGAYSPFDRDHDGDTDVRDVAVAWDQFVDFGSRHFNTIKSTVYKVTTSPKVTQARTRITKAVDGFSKRSSK